MLSIRVIHKRKRGSDILATAPATVPRHQTSLMAYQLQHSRYDVNIQNHGFTSRCSKHCACLSFLCNATAHRTRSSLQPPNPNSTHGIFTMYSLRRHLGKSWSTLSHSCCKLYRYGLTCNKGERVRGDTTSDVGSTTNGAN
jgi:hypothetical protein